MNTLQSSRGRNSAVVVGLAIALAGCSSAPSQRPASSTTSRASAAIGSTSSSGTPSRSASAAPHIPGYAVADFPPVPLFTLPDLGMLDTSLAGFSIKFDRAVGRYPGLTVSPARCDSSRRLVSGLGATRLYGDGSGNYTGPDGSIQNYGDGSGSFSLNGTKVTVYGDGSGNYSKASVSINSYGDGSGNYTDGTTTVRLYGDGSGNYSNGAVTISNYGDGSGSYTDGKVVIHNYGDGSGNYTDGTTVVNNYGDGSGNYTDGSATLTRYTDGTGTMKRPFPKIAPVPKLGNFPAMGSIKPITSCGTVITLRDNVLFDFSKGTVRPEARPVLTSLATALKDLKVATAQVGGHTDAISSEEFNQALSQRRAAAVVAALKGLGVTSTLQATGYGETRPVAPNSIKGQDNPAGRQLNRRVEIFIPAASSGS